MKGRKNKPTAIKKLEGNIHKERMNEYEPKLDLSIPVPPNHLTAVAKREWRRVSPILFKAGVLSEADRSALAAYCDAYALWVYSSNKLKKRGSMIQTSPNGYEQQSAWVSIRKQALADMHKFLTEFGMTPASRTRINVNPNNKNVDPMEQLFEECAEEEARNRGGA